jgi:hypothetical protein
MGQKEINKIPVREFFRVCASLQGFPSRCERLRVLE